MLAIGETIEIQGSGSTPYKVKNCDGVVWSCTCPSWRNKGGNVMRTCKHLIKLNGESFELSRIGAAAPAPATAPAPGPSPVTATATPPSAGNGGVILARAAAAGRALRPDEKQKLNGPKLLLAEHWHQEIDPTDYHMSVKLDGCRALFRNNEFISRQGNVFHAPSFFKAGMPDVTLDGEAWLARRSFEKTMSIVRSLDAGDRWKDIKYVVFDAPEFDGTFEERLAYLNSLNLPPHVIIHPHIRCKGKQHLQDELHKAVMQGDEGLMLREPGSRYVGRRSNTLLKAKLFQDMDATVREYVPGKGRHKNRMGGLIVVLDNGIDFHLGTGFTDDIRESPPPIGSKITFSYTELSSYGVPKCASFLRIRKPE